jgi:hypothetical protein
VTGDFLDTTAALRLHAVLGMAALSIMLLA